MADVQPFRAIHFDQATAGPLDRLTAPPYDVIDAAQRAELVARSPHNVVEIDLPVGEEPYAHAAELFEHWQLEGILGPGRPAGDLGPDPDLPRPGRRRANPQRLLCPGRDHRLRPGPDPPARAHASGGEGGPPAPDARHSGQPLPHLLALFGSRWRSLGRARAGDGDRAFRSRDRRRGHDPPAVARDRSGHGCPRPGGAGARGAIDRRRPPPLRDGPHLRRRDRRRGSTSPGPDEPGLDVGPGACDLSHPPRRVRRSTRTAGAGSTSCSSATSC